MRESENYRNTLDDVRARADRLFPDKIMLSAPDIARLLGCERSTIYRRGFTSGMTLEEIARTICRKKS